MAKKDEFADAKVDGEKNFNESAKTLVEAKNYNAAVEELRTALAKLGLKIIEDINAKRAGKPEIFYNALVAIFNAIK